MTIGERIRNIRQSLKWTQDKLAQEADISKSFLSEIENDKSNASGDNLLKISNVLNVSMDYLMKGESVPFDKMPQKVEIPFALSALAEEKGFAYKATLMLLSTHQSLIAKRSSRGKSEMTKEDWWNLYKNLKDYLE